MDLVRIIITFVASLVLLTVMAVSFNQEKEALSSGEYSITVYEKIGYELARFENKEVVCYHSDGFREGGLSCFKKEVTKKEVTKKKATKKKAAKKKEN